MPPAQIPACGTTAPGSSPGHRHRFNGKAIGLTAGSPGENPEGSPPDQKKACYGNGIEMSLNTAGSTESNTFRFSYRMETGGPMPFFVFESLTPP